MSEPKPTDDKARIATLESTVSGLAFTISTLQGQIATLHTTVKGK